MVQTKFCKPKIATGSVFSVTIRSNIRIKAFLSICTRKQNIAADTVIFI